MGLGQSWTDLFSNHTHFPVVDVQRQFEHLIGAGTMPAELMLPVMHEAAHHWTFYSPVGNTLAILNARVRRSALHCAAGRTKSDHPLLMDYISSRVATKMLRPMAEGIALGMEFDAFSRRSPFVSTPLLSMARGFAPLDSPSNPELSALSISNALVEARMSQAGISRKLNVYADKLNAKGSGYLLGYLAVRSMMRHLWYACPRLLEESDLCLAFLRSYLYNDYAFIDVLLERGNNEIAHANAIKSYLADRLWAISEVTAEQVDLFEALAAIDCPVDDPRYATALGFDAERGRRGQQRGEDLQDDINTVPTLSSLDAASSASGDAALDVDSLESMLWGLDLEFAHARRMVFLGSAPAHVVTADGVCTASVDGVKLVEGVMSAEDEGEGEGGVSVFYDSSAPDGRRIVQVTRGSVTVAVAVRGPAAEQWDGEPFSPSLSREFMLQASRVYEELVDTAVDNSWLNVAICHFIDQLPEVCRGIYEDVALRFVNPPDLQAVRSVLEQGGIRKLLDGDRDLSVALAVTGAATQKAPFRMLAEAALAAKKCKPKAIEELASMSKRGFSLLECRNQIIIAMA
ncbi:hypothetical protein [Kineococcus sp. SYSU DK005]|uniref:hypothetical protein n=1 Tax=Kineococcus sp. SYSU DK005 TaxID=3383126 RepID=UPI003D7C7CCB